MAEPRPLEVLDVIQECISSGASFVVEAGAGSGKTRTLVDTVRGLLSDNSAALAKTGQRIVCITYTNVAKDEIATRLEHDPLVLVGTIHEFLWEVMAPFQKELRAAMLSINAGAKKPAENLEQTLASQRITYGQFGRHFDRGELSHDDVIAAAALLFGAYPKIAQIAGARYPFVLVDEYQDTSEQVVELLLKHFVLSASKPVVGFFGDSMQQIYDSRVGDIASEYGLVRITKPENYRCSKAVIAVLNRLRIDLQQVPAGDNVAGDVHLLTSRESGKGAYQRSMDLLASSGWTTANTKILMLTHKGIAREIGFPRLLEAYGIRSFGNDHLMAREDEFGEFFTYVSDLQRAYVSKRFGDFLALLGKSGATLSSPGEKKDVASQIEQLGEVTRQGSVGDVLAAVTASSLIPRTRKLIRMQEKLSSDPPEDDEPMKRRREFYEAVLNVPWAEVEQFIDYSDELTPFSTKHGVKGAEFTNVLVIIDDSLWNMYKFSSVFTADETNPGRLDRSKKLLYVCFSRAMSGLAVLCLGAFSSDELAGARNMLGVDVVDEI